jgi:hypothetical protein
MVDGEKGRHVIVAAFFLPEKNKKINHFSCKVCPFAPTIH